MVCTIHYLDHEISHPWYYRSVKQANLQDYPAGLSVVKGLPMAAISGLGVNLEKPHLVWMMHYGITIICMTGFSKWLALSITEQSIGRKGFLHLQ